MKRSTRLAVATAGVALFIPGSAQAAGVTPNPKDYGSQTVGTSSAATTFTLTTSATGCFDPPDCTIPQYYSVDTSALGGASGTTTRVGDFSIHNQNCGYPSQISGPIAYSTNFCYFDASFVPTATGPRTLTLNFPDNGGATGTLVLTGTGFSPNPAGQRAAAIKKCKKKFPKGSARRKKCLRHARRLPV